MKLLETYDSSDGTTRVDDPVAVLVNAFEDAGATFRMKPHGDMHIDLDGLGPPPRYAAGLAAALQLLMPEIKAYVEQRTIDGIRT